MSGVGRRVRIRDAAHGHKAREITCQWCGLSVMRVVRGRKDAARCCSRSCGFELLRQERRLAREVRLASLPPKGPALTTKPCANCASDFNGRATQLYCSQRCQTQAQSKRSSQANKAPRQCKECATQFAPAYGDKRRDYCSSACMDRSLNRTRGHVERARLRRVKVEPVNPTKVFDRDGWRCHLCGRATPRKLRGTLKPNAPELDHIVPLSKGGEHSYRNTACACRECNHRKSDTVLGQPSLLAA